MALRSFLEIAKDSDFPIQNLPFGVFQPKQDTPRVGVAIGDLVFDLSALEELGHFQSPEFRGRKVFSEGSLNSFLALGRPAWRKTREILHIFWQQTRRYCATIRLFGVEFSIRKRTS